MAQNRRQFGERIIGTKENAQLVQTWQIIGQRRERISRQIENFQRLGKIKNLARKHRQAARQFQSPAPRQFPATQLFKRIQSCSTPIKKARTRRAFLKTKLPVGLQQIGRDITAVCSQFLQHGLVQPHIHLRRIAHLLGRATQFGRQFLANGQAAVQTEQFQ